MGEAQELRDEVGRVGRLLDAGHRGIPIGGELLVAFGAVLGLLGLFATATAFGYLPPTWMPSPLAGAAGFLAFAVLFRGRTERLLHTVLVAVVAAAATELTLRVTVSALPGPGAGIPILLAAVVLLALGVLIGLWRLGRSAAAVSPANRALVKAWLGLATAMAVTIALCAIVGVRTNNFFGFMLLPGLFWILWGAGWWTSAAATGSRWMYGVAAGAWLLALWHAATFDVFTISIVGLAVLAIAPGVQLLREARATHEA